MSDVLKIIVLMIGLSLCIWVVTLMARKKMNERNTLVWLGGVIAILVLSIHPHWLDVVSGWIGVDYPPSLLFLFSFIVLLVVNLYQSSQISQLYAKIKEVSQAMALEQVQTESYREEAAAAKSTDEG
ncbi:MAG TPA: DUF2304 domain-containing protein [Bacilli bacterium]